LVVKDWVFAVASSLLRAQGAGAARPAATACSSEAYADDIGGAPRVRFPAQIGGDALDGLLAMEAGTGVGIIGGDKALLIGGELLGQLGILGPGGGTTFGSGGKMLAVDETEKFGEGLEEMAILPHEFGRQHNGDGKAAIVSGLDGEIVEQDGKRSGHLGAPPESGFNPTTIIQRRIRYIM
jgi:hypothetical protein